MLVLLCTYSALAEMDNTLRELAAAVDAAVKNAREAQGSPYGTPTAESRPPESKDECETKINAADDAIREYFKAGLAAGYIMYDLGAQVESITVLRKFTDHSAPERSIRYDTTISDKEWLASNNSALIRYRLFSSQTGTKTAFIENSFWANNKQSQRQITHYTIIYTLGRAHVAELRTWTAEEEVLGFVDIDQDNPVILTVDGPTGTGLFYTIKAYLYEDQKWVPYQMSDGDGGGTIIFDESTSELTISHNDHDAPMPPLSEDAPQVEVRSKTPKKTGSQNIRERILKAKKEGTEFGWPIK